MNQSENKKTLSNHFDYLAMNSNDDEMVELLKQLITIWNLPEKDFKIVQKRWVNAYRKIYVNHERYQKVIAMIDEIENVYKKEVIV